MRVTAKQAMASAAGLIASLSILDQNQMVELEGNLTYRKVNRKLAPVFDSVQVGILNLKKNDLVYFDYRDQSSGSDRVRRGYVEEVRDDSVLIFDLEALDHQTGKVGAFRRSTKGGITKLYRLVDPIPF